MVCPGCFQTHIYQNICLPSPFWSNTCKGTYPAGCILYFPLICYFSVYFLAPAKCVCVCVSCWYMHIVPWGCACSKSFRIQPMRLCWLHLWSSLKPFVKLKPQSDYLVLIHSRLLCCLRTCGQAFRFVMWFQRESWKMGSFSFIYL